MFEERVYCGELTVSDIGKSVVLAGWVDTKRDLGGVVFLEIRDVTGIMQAVVHPAAVSGDTSSCADRVRDEYCVMVRGKVVKRSDETVNPNLKTGTIEVDIEELQILNASLVPPFPLDSRESVSEDLRLKYRYLDLRRKEMRDAVIMRHRVMQETRKYLTENRFIEIETPMLNKSTPEGARDFLVPSRINRGMFFALPQSPQLFKQILMVAGFDRYFQIVKCFRDEDLRNDRQPEFTQIDLEMSFVTPDMVMGTIEGLLKRLVMEMTGKDIKDSFPRLTYDEAMSRFGKDAPDMRFGLELVECSDIFRESQFQVFTAALAARGIIKGVAVADEGKISRKMVDDYAEFVKIYRAKGMPWVRFRSGNFEGGISKFLSDTEKGALVKAFDLQGDMLVIFSS
ncbi:MAG TPA: aspartate--tRNA ligase, partial [Spirochaetota bacterium]|nr:aspartate--tRNA ligase [Spirochaetota bacterium]